MKRPKLKSRRDRAAAEVARLLREDPVFRENFLRALRPATGALFELVLNCALPTVPTVASNLDSGPGPKE